MVDAATVRVGDNRIHSASPEGSKAQISVGKGDKAFLMRIPKEYYIEDQLAKQQEVNRLEQSIKQSSGGDYGQVSVTVGKPA